MGSDHNWSDNMHLPAGQPADLNLLLNIISNLYSLKEDQTIIRGRANLNSETLYMSNKQELRFDIGHHSHGNVHLQKNGSSSSHYVPFTHAFTQVPVVIAQPRTYKGHRAATTVNVHSVTKTGFSVTYWGYQNKIHRGVMYIACGVR